MLEHAQLIKKQRRGKEKFIIFSPGAVVDLQVDVERYKALWESRLDRLEKVLKEEK